MMHVVRHCNSNEARELLNAKRKRGNECDVSSYCHNRDVACAAVVVVQDEAFRRRLDTLGNLC